MLYCQLKINKSVKRSIAIFSLFIFIKNTVKTQKNVNTSSASFAGWIKKLNGRHFTPQPSFRGDKNLLEVTTETENLCCSDLQVLILLQILCPALLFL